MYAPGFENDIENFCTVVAAPSGSTPEFTSVVPSYGPVAGVGKVKEASVSTFGAGEPGGTKVTECGSGPAISHVTVVPVATLIDSGRNSSMAMFGSCGSFRPPLSMTSGGTAAARGADACAGDRECGQSCERERNEYERGPTSRTDLHLPNLRKGDAKVGNLAQPGTAHAPIRTPRTTSPSRIAASAWFTSSSEKCFVTIPPRSTRPVSISSMKRG